MNDNGSATALFGAFTLVYCFVVIAIIAFSIFLYWRIFSKAGYNGAMSLLALIPGVGLLIMICILAFGTWPALQELEFYRPQRGAPPMGPGGTGYPPQPPYPPQQQYPQY